MQAGSVEQFVRGKRGLLLSRPNWFVTGFREGTHGLGATSRTTLRADPREYARRRFEQPPDRGSRLQRPRPRAQHDLEQFVLFQRHLALLPKGFHPTSLT